MPLNVSICIACHNQAQFLLEAIQSCLMQTYSPVEIIVLDDGSTDKTPLFKVLGLGRTGATYKYFRSDEPSGSGEAFNKAVSYATGDIVVLLCADDFFIDSHVVEDMVNIFDSCLEIVHISRWYHQFVDGDSRPVRAWRGDNIIELANNPSGLAFRRSVMPKLSNKMFVEAPEAVWRITSNYLPGIFHAYSILKYDTVAVRVHKSTARSPEYYKKMWNSSPVLEWAKLGWKSKDFTSLIQIKNYFTNKAVWEEVCNFIKVDKWNLIEPGFWFYSITSLITHRDILNKIPEIYRSTWGKWTTMEVKRER